MRQRLVLEKKFGEVFGEDVDCKKLSMEEMQILMKRATGKRFSVTGDLDLKKMV